MKCIAAVDNNWAIGFKGKLLVSIPNDQKMFRNETKGKVVVLGRKTLETFPNGLPLAGRTNINRYGQNYLGNEAMIEEMMSFPNRFSHDDEEDDDE